MTARSSASAPIPRYWLILGLGLMVIGSVVAVALELSLIGAVLAVAPGTAALRVGRRRALAETALDESGPRPSYPELLIVFAPMLVLGFAASFVVDTTKWYWLAPFLTAMAVGFSLAEYLAWTRRTPTGERH